MAAMAGVERWAKAQFGLVSRGQLIAAGLGRSSIAWKLNTGELQRTHELVFRLRGAPRTWESIAMEGLLVAGEASLLSHQTAAWLYGIDGIPRPVLIDVSVVGTAPRNLPGYRFHRSIQGPGPRWIKRGLPVTRVAKTLVDLAGELAPEALELALDSAQRQYRMLSSWLDEYVKGLNRQGTPGLGTLLELLALRRDGATDSALEVRVLRALRRLGLKPVLRFEVCESDGTFVMRLDFAWPGLKVALHVDGYRWHHQRERADRDARQRSRLQVLGWRTVTVTSTTFAEGAWLKDLLSLLQTQQELALR